MILDRETQEHLEAIHRPEPEEVERTHEDGEPCDSRDRFGCQGHMETIQVCATCSRDYEDEHIVFYPWPCETAKLLRLHTTTEAAPDA